MSDELPDLELRKEWTRLRALLYESHDLALSTDDRDGHRWLTDRFVLLDVTGSIAVEGVEDGCYKLVLSSSKAGDAGFRRRTHEFESEERALENYLGGGIVDYLTSVERDRKWMGVWPSEWSVAEHPGKAMLLVAEDPDFGPPHPVLMGESTWTSLHRHYESPCVEYDPYSGQNLFRVMVPQLRVVAYVAGIRIPDGQEEIAKAIAKLVDTPSTSN